MSVTNSLFSGVPIVQFQGAKVNLDFGTKDEHDAPDKCKNLHDITGRPVDCIETLPWLMIWS